MEILCLGISANDTANMFARMLNEHLQQLANGRVKYAQRMQRYVLFGHAISPTRMWYTYAYEYDTTRRTQTTFIFCYTQEIIFLFEFAGAVHVINIRT